MNRLFRFLLMGLGLPMVAQQISHHGHNVAQKLLVVTFLTTHKKKLFTIAIFALLGSIFTICGASLVAFSFALNSQLQTQNTIGSTLIVSLCVTAIGLGLTGYAWREIQKIEKAFELEKQISEASSPSLTRMVFDSVLNAIFGGPIQHIEHNKTLN